MSIRTYLKQNLPAYRTERRLQEKIDGLNRSLRELGAKNEYLFWMSMMEPNETMEETKKRVFLRMPKATGRLRNIQSAENYILKRVKKVCDDNGLELFLVGGTLLGAVRHKGFIPWDNDIDIGMMKVDYLKLRELFEKDEELTVQYCYNYEAGLKMSKVKFRATPVFWIDILVFDRIDCTQEDLASVWKQTQEANLAHSRMIKALSEGQKNGCRPVSNAVLDKALSAFEEEQHTRLFFGRGEFFCEPIDCPYWSRDERGIRPINRFFPLLKDAVEFEGETYDVWQDYDYALFKSYGDIWSMPFSIREPHTTEFDEGFDKAIAYLREHGIISEKDKEA